MASNRLTGKYGSLFLHVSAAAALTSVVKIGETFEARFETAVTMHECTRQGEGFARFMPGISHSTLTCRAHIIGATALLALSDDTLSTLAAADTTLPPLVRCAFKLITWATEAAGAPATGDGAPATPGADLTIAGQQILQGFGWLSTANLSLPFDQDAVEEIVIQVDGDYQFKLTT